MATTELQKLEEVYKVEEFFFSPFGTGLTFAVVQSCQMGFILEEEYERRKQELMSMNQAPRNAALSFHVHSFPNHIYGKPNI
jgi:hypothetical protein